MLIYASALYLYSHIIHEKPKVNKFYMSICIVCVFIQTYLQINGFSAITPLFTVG